MEHLVHKRKNALHSVKKRNIIQTHTYAYTYSKELLEVILINFGKPIITKSLLKIKNDVLLTLW